MCDVFVGCSVRSGSQSSATFGKDTHESTMSEGTVETVVTMSPSESHLDSSCKYHEAIMLLACELPIHWYLYIPPTMTLICVSVCTMNLRAGDSVVLRCEPSLLGSQFLIFLRNADTASYTRRMEPHLCGYESLKTTCLFAYS